MHPFFDKLKERARAARHRIVFAEGDDLRVITAAGRLKEEGLADRSAELGAWLLYELRKLRHPHIKAIRGRGLLIGIELLVPARSYCERLKELGLLCKETHDFVIRLAPPLIISDEDLAWAAGQVRKAFEG